MNGSLVIGVTISAFLVGTVTGCQIGHGKRTQDAVQAALQAERNERIADVRKSVTDGILRDVNSKQEAINENAKSLKEYIPVYIKGDDNCTLSPDAGRLFDAISAGMSHVPPTATGTETEPSAPVITLTDVAEAENANYAYCRSELTKYQGLWDWAEGVAVAGE